MDDDTHTSPPCETCSRREKHYLADARRREKLAQDILTLFVDNPETSEMFAPVTQDAVLALHANILDLVLEYGKSERRSNLERFARLVGQGVDPKVAAEHVRSGR